MRILVVSQYYYPEQFRINDICECLVKRGHSVTVLTGLPNYPEGEIYPGYEDKYKETELHNGVNIIRCNVRPRHKGSFQLFRSYLSYVLAASKRIKKLQEQFDVVYVYQMSPVTTIYPASLIKKKENIPLYVYCCDVWPDSVRDMSEGKIMGTNNPIYIIAKWISRSLYSKADMIGVKCNQFSEYLRNVCSIDSKKCKLNYEHAEDSYLSISENPKDNSCYDFMFLGNIGISQNCDYLVKAAKLLKTDKAFKLHFVGSGSAMDSLQQYVQDSGMSDLVVFHGRHPVSEINEFYEIADCCMLILAAKTAIGLTPPAKLVGYMAASRPIIAAAEGATKDILAEANCGLCVKPDDIQSISNAMKYAIENQDEFDNKGINGREYFKTHFTLEKHIDELEKQLSELIGGQ